MPSTYTRRSTRGIYNIGNRTVIVVPCCGPGLSAMTVPSCISTSHLTSANPIPRPPSRRFNARSTCVKRSNTCSSCAGGIPTPLSLTRMQYSVALRSTWSQIVPPRVVYFAELLRMLVITCAMRMWSPRNGNGRSGMFCCSWSA